MKMGSVAELALDDSVALRLRFDGRAAAARDAVLPRPGAVAFRRREWKRAAATFRRAPAVAPRGELEFAGKPVRYEMTLEPQRLTALPLLEMAPHGGRRRASRACACSAAATSNGRPSARSPSGCASTPRPICAFATARASACRRCARTSPCPPATTRAPSPGRAALRARAGATPAPMRAASRRRVLQHIATRRLRLHARARQLRRRERARRDRRVLARSQARLLRALRRGLRRRHARARRAGARRHRLPGRRRAADRRLLRSCATAMPHAWAEYWQAGLGWVRADPTAAVAPDRIGLSRQLVPRPGLVAGAIGTMSPTLLAGLREAWEAANNRWNQWVLNYSRGQQLDLLKSLGVSRPSWEDLAYAADRRALRREPRRRRLGLVGPAAPGPVDAPRRAAARRAAARSASPPRRTMRRAPWRVRCASASARRRRGWRACSTRSIASATRAARRACHRRAGGANSRPRRARCSDRSGTHRDNSSRRRRRAPHAEVLAVAGCPIRRRGDAGAPRLLCHRRQAREEARAPCRCRPSPTTARPTSSPTARATT